MKVLTLKFPRDLRGCFWDTKCKFIKDFIYFFNSFLVLVTFRDPQYENLFCFFGKEICECNYFVGDLGCWDIGGFRVVKQIVTTYEQDDEVKLVLWRNEVVDVSDFGSR